MFNLELSDFYDLDIQLDTEKLRTLSVYGLYTLIEEARAMEARSDGYEYKAIAKILKQKYSMGIKKAEKHIMQNVENIPQTIIDKDYKIADYYKKTSKLSRDQIKQLSIEEIAYLLEDVVENLGWWQAAEYQLLRDVLIRDLGSTLDEAKEALAVARSDVGDEIR